MFLKNWKRSLREWYYITQSPPVNTLEAYDRWWLYSLGSREIVFCRNTLVFVIYSLLRVVLLNDNWWEYVNITVFYIAYTTHEVKFKLFDTTKYDLKCLQIFFTAKISIFGFIYFLFPQLSYITLNKLIEDLI